ncbi:MAG TPA: PilZ domain-containing protein [Candidatus Angelobacter sp.]|nr:PilZ domain-containing protein [Candidatus Angelobacter sp.]
MQHPFTALFLSREALAVDTMDKVFDDFGIDADLCLSASTAKRLLRERPFDLLVLDFDMVGAMEVLDYDGSRAQERPSAVIAITRGVSALEGTQNKRVFFEVQKPFTVDLMAKTLKAAYSLVVKTKRDAFRHQVVIQASTSFADNSGAKRLLPGTVITDISETGMRIKTTNSLPVGTTISVAFKLPETNTTLHTTCSVIWSDAEGQGGVRFQFIPPLEQRDLQRWMDARCPWDAELLPQHLQSRPSEPVAGSPL